MRHDVSGGACRRPTIPSLLEMFAKQPRADGGVAAAAARALERRAHARLRQYEETTRVAVCITGELRNFDSPCTLPALLERMVAPLGADVYVFVNAPDLSNKERLRRILDDHGSRVRAFSVENRRTSNRTAPECPDARGGNNGYPQSIGLAECGAAAIPNGYDWILRVRTPTWAYPSRCARS